MDKNFLDIFGTAILGFFFGIYDEEARENGKLLLGKYIVEHGGVEQVYNELYQHTTPTDMQKQEIIKTLTECVNFYKEKGTPKVGDKVVLLDPVNKGQVVKVTALLENGYIVYDGGQSKLYRLWQQ